MALQYMSLDADTRRFMRIELDLDIRNQTLYDPPRLTPLGSQVWPGLLGQAVDQHNDEWLAEELRRGRLFAAYEQRNVKGKIVNAAVPVNAHTVLAEGQFNRFYARALCLRTIESNGTEVVVYRARYSANPRPESQALIGRRVLAADLLADLRASPFETPSLGVGYPNSGLSVQLL